LPTLRPSLRANGSGECAPDDRLREAIYFATRAERRIASLLRYKERMHRFVALLLAMTTTYSFTIPRRETPEFYPARSAFSSEGAGNAGRLVRPQPRV